MKTETTNQYLKELSLHGATHEDLVVGAFEVVGVPYDMTTGNCLAGEFTEYRIPTGTFAGSVLVFDGNGNFVGVD